MRSERTIIILHVIIKNYSAQSKRRAVNITDSTNYRGIALSSIFGKLLDQIVLAKFADKLVTSDLQFGFKKQRSTNMCTMSLKETLEYYSNADGVAFCTLLDATKAFDRVNFCKLFVT